MMIAVDFDGTIVEHRYPSIGKQRYFAFETLKALQKDGHQLILWTYRDGKLLDEAVEYCRKNGVEFYAVNCSFPGEILEPGQSRKVDADLFIDDRIVFGFPGWGEIYQAINPDSSSLGYIDYRKQYEQKKRKGLPAIIKRFLGLDS
ncbi:MAG: hydrolase [Bacteroidales bacterium]|jgi:hydroxymethylpyrimidine pyrophosphatase-like HAD family hydrolase|nr:hydrolase [Bacteroidales bacterium]HBG87212.1 hydrolase [Marinilabiliaceae bacterium]HBX89195.1 hydrolase [Marinilabiliaceae bacterium]